MQSLRYAYRRALRGTVIMQKPRVGSERAYNTESAPRAALRKSKEERFKLVTEFVAKYKASNNGKLPGMSVLRKEVGGKYEILKEILHGIKTDQEKLEVEISAGGTKESPQVLDSSRERQLLQAEVLEKERMLVSGMGETTKIKKDDNVTDSRTAAKATLQREQSMTSGKDGSQPITDIFYGIDEGDNDSDVATPEYQQTPRIETTLNLPSKLMEPLPEFCLLITRTPAFTTCADLRAAFEDCGGIINASVSNSKTDFRGSDRCAIINFKTEEGLKAAKMKEKVLLRGKLVDLKGDWDRNTTTICEVKQAKAPYCASKTEAQQNGLDVVNDVNNKPARHLQVDGLEGTDSLSTRYSQYTAVIRIMNVPLHVTESKLKSLCDSIASVYRVDFRRGQIADVHFNVNKRAERKFILRRLKEEVVGDCRLKAVGVQRFSCGNQRLRNVQELKIVRGNLLKCFERNFQQLCCQFKDYRELLAMKWAV